MPLQEFVERLVQGIAAIGRAQLGLQRIECLEPEDAPRIEPVGIAPPLFDAGDGQTRGPRLERRARLGPQPGRVGRPAGRSPRPRRRSCAGRAGCIPARSPSRARSRTGHRGAPASATARWARRLRARHASAARARRPRAATKSCADRPMRRSGCCRPRSLRIGRLIHGPVSTAGGQVPSFRPPSTRRSARCKRASSGPQIERRGWRPKVGRMVSGSSIAANRPGHSPDAIAGRLGPGGAQAAQYVGQCGAGIARPQRLGRRDLLRGGDGRVEQRVGRCVALHQRDQRSGRLVEAVDQRPHGRAVGGIAELRLLDAGADRRRGPAPA